MGIRLPGSSGIDPGLVDKLIKAEGIPLEKAKSRKEETVEVKKEVERLQTYINELDSAVNGLKTRSDFYKLKVESSHPDIIDGIVDGMATLGTYEFEVRGLAKNEKELAYGFPDKDKTPVGFGYMIVEREDDGAFEVTIEPGSTLEQVAARINDLDAGVRAMVINTQYKPDGYRLLVISEKSGEEAKVYMDEDTTFLEFKEQVTGRNLDVLFEDVPVTDTDNTLDELLEGVTFKAKRSEPGTRVQVTIDYDIDATLEGIKSFIEKYNQVVEFANEQSTDPREAEPGKLSGDGSVKRIMRMLQQAVIPGKPGLKYQTLAQVGITTNSKTGFLEMDEAKVRQSLAEDYEEVASLFIRTPDGDGLGGRVAKKIKSFRDPVSGVVKTRLNGLDRIIRSQDEEIERRERQLQNRENNIRRKFANLESQLAGLQSQGNFVQQRLGPAPAPQGGGG